MVDGGRGTHCGESLYNIYRCLCSLVVGGTLPTSLIL